MLARWSGTRSISILSPTPQRALGYAFALNWIEASIPPGRSEAFEEAIAACFPEAGYVHALGNRQHELVAMACTLCIKHASVLRTAFTTGAPNSGTAVLRLQYEALLRAAWLYAATPAQVDKLARSLDLEAEQAAKNLPGYMDMLDAVVKKAPQGLSAPIAEFNQYSRHALNSFVHSGIHPLRRAREGYPQNWR